MKPVALSVVTYDRESPNVCCKEERPGGVDSTARKASRPGEACLLEKWPAAVGQQRRCRHAAYIPDVFTAGLRFTALCVLSIVHTPSSSIRPPIPTATFFFFFFALTYAA